MKIYIKTKQKRALFIRKYIIEIYYIKKYISFLEIFELMHPLEK
jgi:hypothetical protein